MKSRLPGGWRRGRPARVSSFCRPTLKINTKCRRLLLCSSISLLFCLRWTSRQGVFVFSNWTRVGDGFERSGSRAGDISSLPVLHTLVLTTWKSSQRLGLEGGRRSTNRKKHLLWIFKPHAYVCEMDGSQPGGDCWEGARTTVRGPRPRLPPNDPHPA